MGGRTETREAKRFLRRAQTPNTAASCSPRPGDTDRQTKQERQQSRTAGDAEPQGALWKVGGGSECAAATICVQLAAEAKAESRFLLATNLSSAEDLQPQSEETVDSLWSAEPHSSGEKIQFNLDTVKVKLTGLECFLLPQESEAPPVCWFT